MDAGTGMYKLALNRDYCLDKNQLHQVISSQPSIDWPPGMFEFAVYYASNNLGVPVLAKAELGQVERITTTKMRKQQLTCIDTNEKNLTT